jgi:L1 cell adhesion molecule like protein
MTSIGIDLGTTFSCCAAWVNDRPDIIVNEEGGRTTPSQVAFTKDERLVGVAAYNYSFIDPANTLFCSKRLIGRPFNDPELQTDIQTWPFVVVEDNGKPVYQVRVQDQDRHYTPEEISSAVLAKLREFAVRTFGGEVKDAVITVPAYFSNAQRQATRDAGMIAGLNVLRIINEPTAAALAYGYYHVKSPNATTVMVYDLGGGTFDVSILSIAGAKFTVLATGGNTHLGGEDFDHLFIDYIVQDILKRHGLDFSKEPKALRKIRKHCVAAKHALSTAASTQIFIDSLLHGEDYIMEMTAARLERMISPIVEKTLVVVESVLKDAKLRPDTVDEVLLVGGSSRIPKVKRLLKELFGSNKIRERVNPDEVVAQGAAILAAVLTGQMVETEPPILEDVTPLSLGVESDGGLFTAIIERNTHVPCEINRMFTTRVDYQTHVTFPIMEGERLIARPNNLLGSLNIVGIPPGPAGQERLAVRFFLDEDGILTVEARSVGTKLRNKVTIQNAGQLSREEVSRIVKEAQQFKRVDTLVRERIEVLNGLHSYMGEVEHLLRKGRIPPERQQHVRQALEHVSTALDDDPSASVAQLKEYRDELAKACTQDYSNV